MRITNAQITAMMQGSMNANSAQLGKLMQQMATGQRLLQPSDDPVASVRLLRIQREEASLAQYRSNIGTLSGSLATQETNLTAASDTMLSLRDLLLWAANDTNGDDDLRAIAGEMANIEQTLVSFLNVRDEEGRFLFSGTLSNNPAVTFDPLTGSYQASGNDKHRQAAVANGVLIDENVTVMEIFGTDLDFLNRLHELVGMLQDPLLDASDPLLKQQLTDTLNELDRTHVNLLGQVSELGGRQNTLTLLDDSNTEVSLVNQKIEGELSQLDYAGASIDLNQYMLALQATQQTYLKLNQLTLFSLL
ncbi:flagellar hook-associated protein FlgL [Halopseudomonas phragmitis]|uniref:Flagellar hook-associated protein 3 n=2 Tax=Pseudomonadaceae TaxID=135621 RepID=A0A1V0B9S1_9GAMM|nr:MULTISPECIES: flagellar hook-associated protein FlgL [Pseudomonadaceae]AQZ96689.1 flagellar hook-associated protein 3 [Halopseudomonas phragmitis]RHW20100.1 flagellar hook-associated protein 3 [Pseudomonas jilinensis]